MTERPSGGQAVAEREGHTIEREPVRHELALDETIECLPGDSAAIGLSQMRERYQSDDEFRQRYRESAQNNASVIVEDNDSTVRCHDVFDLGSQIRDRQKAIERLRERAAEGYDIPETIFDMLSSDESDVVALVVDARSRRVYPVMKDQLLHIEGIVYEVKGDALTIEVVPTEVSSTVKRAAIRYGMEPNLEPPAPEPEPEPTPEVPPPPPPPEPEQPKTSEPLQPEPEPVEPESAPEPEIPNQTPQDPGSTGEKEPEPRPQPLAPPEPMSEEPAGKPKAEPGTEAQSPEKAEARETLDEKIDHIIDQVQNVMLLGASQVEGHWKTGNLPEAVVEATRYLELFTTTENIEREDLDRFENWLRDFNKQVAEWVNWQYLLSPDIKNEDDRPAFFMVRDTTLEDGREIALCHYAFPTGLPDWSGQPHRYMTSASIMPRDTANELERLIYANPEAAEVYYRKAFNGLNDQLIGRQTKDIVEIAILDADEYTDTIEREDEYKKALDEKREIEARIAALEQKLEELNERSVVLLPRGTRRERKQAEKELKEAREQLETQDQEVRDAFQRVDWNKVFEDAALREL